MLACYDYPFAHNNIFREACLNQDDLYGSFGFHMWRSEFYTGTLHSILYAPLFYLFRLPQGQYVFGLIFFFAFAWLLSRMTQNPKFSFPLFLAFFPLGFQFIHDTGPVKFALVVFPLCAIFFRKAIFSSGAVRYGYAILLSLLVLLATEDKAFFLYLLPSLLFFCLAMAIENHNFKDLFVSLDKAGLALVVIGVTMAIGLSFLLFSTNVQGHYYLFWLMDIAESKHSFIEWLGYLGFYTLYWPAYAHNYFVLNAQSPQTIVFEIVSLIWIIFVFWITIKSKFLSSYPRPKLLLLSLSYLCSIFIFGFLRNTWAGHHFIFLWIPLLVILSDALNYLKPPSKIFLTLSFLIINVASIIALTQLPMQTKVSSDKDAIFSYFDNEDIAAHSIVNFSSWGGYYIKALYGPKTQLITYTEPYEDEDKRPLPLYPAYATKLLELSQITHRTLYNVCCEAVCNITMLETAFGHRVKFVEVLAGLKSWHVFMAVPLSGSDATSP